MNLVNALKQGSNQAGDGTGRRRMQSALIVAQVAVSVVLLVAAGLLLTSFYRLQQVDAGYRSDGVLSAQVYGNFSRYGNINALRRLYMPILDRLEGPRVVARPLRSVPLAAPFPYNAFDMRARRRRFSPRPTTMCSGSDRYFEASAFRGQRRVFTVRYTGEPAPSRVSTSDGRTGRERIRLAPRIDQRHVVPVVGIVGDVRQFGLAVPTVAQIYIPLSQSPFNFAGQVLVRTVADPSRYEGMLRRIVHAVDPNQPVEAVRTLDDLRAEALTAPRLTATLLVVFAALALLMTLAGIGGVIATSVTARTREFGVRMALGAGRETVLAMVVRQGLTLVPSVCHRTAVPLREPAWARLYQHAVDPVGWCHCRGILAAGAIACLGPPRAAS